MAKPKLHDELSEFDLVGEKLKTTSPPTFGEILKLTILYRTLNPNMIDCDIVKKFVLPEIINIWKNVHVEIPLRDEKSLFAQITRFLRNMNKFKKRKCSKNHREHIKLQFKKVLNCTSCKCKLQEIECRYVII